MKFIAPKDVIGPMLSGAARATGGNSGSPVLRGLLLSVVDGKLSVVGTDLDLTIETTGSITVAGTPGQTVVPAKLVDSIVKSLPDGEVVFAVEDTDLTISAGRSRFRVRTFPASEFPSVTATDGDSVSIPVADFIAGVRQVVPAASNDDARPLLTGVLASTNDGVLRLVATDSYRLAVKDLGSIKDIGITDDVLVPARALDELCRVVPKDADDDEVSICFGEHSASFTIRDTTITTRLLDGSFPSYQQLMPESYANTLTVERQVLIDALKRSQIMVRDNTTPVRVNLSGEGAVLSVVSQEVGESSEGVGGEYDGTDILVAFNPRYLSEAVELCASDDVELLVNDSGKPAGVRGVGDDTYVHLVMPVRVS